MKVTSIFRCTYNNLCDTVIHLCTTWTTNRTYFMLRYLLIKNLYIMYQNTKTLCYIGHIINQLRFVKKLFIHESSIFIKILHDTVTDLICLASMLYLSFAIFPQFTFSVRLKNLPMRTYFSRAHANFWTLAICMKVISSGSMGNFQQYTAYNICSNHMPRAERECTNLQTLF